MSYREEMLAISNNQDVTYSSLQEQNDLMTNPRYGLQLAETFVKKFYLDDLDKYEVTKVPRSVRELSTTSHLKMFNISGLVFNKEENVQDRLNNVYSSMHGLGLSVIFMLVSDGKDVHFFIGTKTTEHDFQSDKELAKAFEKAFRGNFPGSEIFSIDSSDCEAMLKELIPESGNNAVTSLTSLPSLKDNDALNGQYIQGIEKFADAMQGEKYTVLIISDPVSGGQIEQVKQGYEELYSELSSLSEYSLTVGENQGVTLSRSEMSGYTDTIGKSVSKTQSFTKGTNVSKSESTTNTFGIGVGTMGNIGSTTSNSTNNVGNIFATLWHYVVGGPLGTAAVNGASKALGGTLGFNASRSKQRGTTTGETNSEQTGNQYTDQNSHSEMYQQGNQEGFTTGSSTSTMVKYENKSIKVFLECIDEHLKRLKECENYGMWSSAVYFISPSKETSIISASTYKGIINGEGTSLESSSMNTWFRDDSTKKINEYLRHFTHPRFHDPDFLLNFNAISEVTPSTMLSTKEMSIQCSLPYKSIPGVFVREMSEFGRDVYDTGEMKSRLRIGSIYHMGKTYSEHEVTFDLDRLREHTFITGSTGSGKSNMVYQLISRLNGFANNSNKSKKGSGKKIATLIIEPAKGEYKQVFGDKFHVFGTNPKICDLLRLNPFKFEPEIHVLEHIDRLIDIFNVCWPMYAAMPAVLREAVEDAYIRCGWNLTSSENETEYDIFPSFLDLLTSLRRVIQGSDYSQEVKDNYTGSLITRVKSLTNGLYGQIFSANEVDNVELFDESTIIDLSRVGSTDTKSMIMGIVVMRLQERRMVQGGINLPLRHITILEEAHNLLKRTSSEQLTEGVNLLGKSVEMISNAIAEMRTYGEGFVIVDQAPGLLDLSVIRNTNTKIVLHLPDMADRELVGRSAALTEEQLVELAKIPTGVAAIYQNKWIEPVLCKIDYFPCEPKKYVYSQQKRSNEFLDQVFVRGRAADYLASSLKGIYPITETDLLKRWLVIAIQ